MNMNMPNLALEEHLDLSQLQTTGSILNINDDYDKNDFVEAEQNDQYIDLIGEPVSDFSELSESMTAVDENGFVKKKVIEEGGGLPLNKDCTVSVAFAGYWEGESEPFDIVPVKKPLTVDLKDNGLIHGLEIAIQSMLVSELSVFLLSHEVAYGEFGVPPRIKPKAKCVFYIKLIKSIITSKKSKINFSEPNMFGRVLEEARQLHCSGVVLYRTCNYSQAVNMFHKAASMLHRCRLADEKEEKVQEKMLKKIYMNLAMSYTKINLPRKACIACNELHRLNSLFNNAKALYLNAKALRMIGDFSSAERKLDRAMKLFPNNDQIQAEMELLIKTRDSFNETTLISQQILQSGSDLASDNFKKEVDTFIKHFKNNVNLNEVSTPVGLNSQEMAYVKEACIRENLFFKKDCLLKDKDEKDDTEVEDSSLAFVDELIDKVET